MLRLLFAAILSAVMTLPALADSSVLDQILERGTLRVGMPGDYRPFGVRNKETGEFSGLDVDMANALAKALGVKLEIIQTKWADILPDLVAGKYDLAAGGVSVTLDRQKKAYFSIPLLRDGKTPIARCTDKDKYSTVEQIDHPNVRVVVNPGGTNERFARANLHSAPIRVWPDNTTIFDEIIKGDADVMITDATETRLQQHLHPELCAIHPDHPFDFSEKAYMLPRDMTFKLYVDQWIHDMVETGKYEAFVKKYL